MKGGEITVRKGILLLIYRKIYCIKVFPEGRDTNNVCLAVFEALMHDRV
jgi:hypothetical protein